MALPNYVKFQRGTLVAYNRLSTKDENTLYFIYDAEDDTKGTLYLGNRLIGSVGGSGGVNNLSELADVIITGAGTGDFLVLNSEGKWTSVSASNVAQTILEAGGSFIDIDENEFILNAVSGALELKGYSSASIGLIPTKTNNGLSWINLPPDLSNRVGTLETNVGNLENGLHSATSAISALQTDMQAVDGKINQAVANANHLTYQVINDLSSATAENVIYLYNDETGATGNIYKEYLITNGVLEQVGSTDIDLSGYATTTSVLALETRVGTLENNYSSLTTSVSVLTSTVNALETTVGSLTTSVSALQSNLGNYVLVSTFNAVVGDLTLVNGIKNSLSTTASMTETLIDIYDRLTWQEISE